MISYAQNAEDAVLARIFDAQTTGFYVDVGAGHPVFDSVTKHFYDRGWSGINIEPMRMMYELLLSERPRDINVQAAVSDREGRVTLYEAPEGNLGSSTLDADVISDYADRPAFTPVEVDAVTFSTLARRHGIERADLVKIDVEGHESQVVSSIDWIMLAPRAIVVEAVRPNTQQPSHEAWEPILVDAGYVCTLFDGINRFYARSDDEEACRALCVPANVFDGVEPYRFVIQIDQAEARLMQAEAALERAQAALAKEHER